MSVWSWMSRTLRSAVNLAHPRDPVLAEWFGADDGDGPYIDADGAMRVSTVYACTSLISETIAALPLHVLRAEGGGTAKAYDHPLYPIVHDQSDPHTGLTSFEWREQAVTHTALRGDSYSLKILGKSGRIEGLRPLHPDRVRPVKLADGRIAFRYTPPDGAPIGYGPDDLLRIPFKMLDGWRSTTPIALHRGTIGLARESRRYLHSIYRNSAAPKGALKVPSSLSDAAVSALRDSWERRHQGAENAGRMAILDGGMEWQPLAMTVDDMQYVQLSQMNTRDIARIFLVPPHKIGDLANATFSNIEHQAIEFVTDTLLRWCRRIEARMNPALLSAADRRAGYYIAFDLKGLLRGDAAARAKLYQALFYIGAMSPNEIRAAEDMNPYDGGDRFFVQGATVPIERAGETITPAPAPPKEEEEPS